MAIADTIKQEIRARRLYTEAAYNQIYNAMIEYRTRAHEAESQLKRLVAWVVGELEMTDQALQDSAVAAMENVYRDNATIIREKYADQIKAWDEKFDVQDRNMRKVHADDKAINNALSDKLERLIEAAEEMLKKADDAWHDGLLSSDIYEGLEQAIADAMKETKT